MIYRLQMIDSLHLISALCFLLAGVSFVTAVILCVVFRIPSIIGLLTGRTARRTVKEIRKHSEQTGQEEAVVLSMGSKAGDDTVMLHLGKGKKDMDGQHTACTQRLYAEVREQETMLLAKHEALPDNLKLQVEDEIEYINSMELIAITLDG